MPNATTGIDKPQSMMRRLLSAAVTLGFIGLAGGLVPLGVTTIADRASAVTEVEAAPLVAVRTQPLNYVDAYEIERRFVGQVEPQQQTDLAFEQGGAVLRVLVDDGDLVAAGEPIAVLDTRLLEADTARLQASRAALEAQAELSRRTTNRQTELKEQGFSSDQALDQASFTLAEISARIAEVDAALVTNRIQIEKAEIRSPFAGRVVARHIDKGATVAGGQPVISLLEHARPQFRAGIDPSLAPVIAKADGLTVEIEGRVVKARLVSLAPNIDPVTRTRIARFALEEDEATVFGQTGSLVVNQMIAQRGAWLPVPALQEGMRGLWQVMTVEQEPDSGGLVIRPEAVEIVHADQDRAFVRGTFTNGARLVLDGPHRVVPGQRVEIIEAGN
ncbi:efflux RND transporter periplasmic adaptor subunit [Hoeflea sp.]|uniref:efflux RND transporter periplasmic adaptor subunit n=1 Tax=Hoeflea sp. TaxID=1940281 RepID=UPI0037497539